ncbi:TetR/AcrR family transcriptional regulator [Streptomyces sp. NPDC088354]|uniref:TetR/AcrR family transcriptional regulator n=1 Tax=unclassified Streptomyces TaxID=2593676 RepID=UPI0029AC9659|nr:TetR/AcrR family transcriptional regulator [Streptomyces sp. MI02-7b]MDX3071764.1 TetR/AcrR family transcriptional regulator [Streptomyces sp. MI02-7b]
MASDGMRMSADERREAAVRAAMTEFGMSGFHGTSTGVIAKRMGVSQPYLFRLFPNKKALFLAVLERCLQSIEGHFEKAAQGLEGGEAFEAMCGSYQELISGGDILRMQLQMYVASVDDEEIRDACRSGWMGLWEYVAARTGVSERETAEFFGTGMLVNVLVALGVPPESRCWAGVEELYGDRFPDKPPGGAH